MDKIIIAGPYNAVAKQKMIADLESDFQVASIASPDEFELHLDAQFIILRTINLSAEVIARMPNLKMIQRWGAGVDIIDVDEASKRGIPVANIAGENAPTVAELTVALMLGVYRQTVTIHNALHRGEWIKDGIDKRCFMISDKTVGIIGLGNIGKHLAKITQAMGAQVQYYDTVRCPELEEKMDYRYVALEELLRTSDIVTLHIPLGDETHYIIGAEQLAMMKPSAILINASRGGLVDEKALYKALQENRLLGAGLDCYENEPLPADSPLLELDNVVLSCHVGGNTADLALRLARRCPQNIRDYTQGRLDAKYVVNREATRYGA